MTKKSDFMRHFDAYMQGRNGVWLPRMMVRFTFFISLVNVITLVVSHGQEASRSVVTFYSVKIVFIIFASLLNWIRRSHTFYLPLLREMSEELYWFYVLAILFLLRVPFVKEFFDQGNSLLLLHVGFSVVILGVLLISLQARIWTHDEQAKKKKRISNLRRKARLSPNDYEQIKPLLVESARKKEPQLISWRITNFLFTILFAATISSLASDVVDAISRRIDILKNLFPPY